jgi:hypothetical protein
MTGDGYHAISPSRVLREIAEAVPEDCRQSMIIIGSLAAGYRYFASQGEMVVRTKDADCLLSPRMAALPAGTAITNRLLAAGWLFMEGPQGRTPGDAQTPEDELPAVRLQRADRAGWFLELLTVPESSAQRDLKWLRLPTEAGHMGLGSFGFLALATVDPLPTPFGLAVARPEMMALANLLEHPTIGHQTMSGGFAGRPSIKRSNKDLGRVIALARLASGEDEAALEKWPELWATALRRSFPDEWRQLAGRAGSGLRQLVQSPFDLEQAHHTCANGLLASMPPTIEAFAITARRLIADAIEPLERFR